MPQIMLQCKPWIEKDIPYHCMIDMSLCHNLSHDNKGHVTANDDKWILAGGELIYFSKTKQHLWIVMKIDYFLLE